MADCPSEQASRVRPLLFGTDMPFDQDGGLATSVVWRGPWTPWTSPTRTDG